MSTKPEPGKTVAEVRAFVNKVKQFADLEKQFFGDLSTRTQELLRVNLAAEQAVLFINDAADERNPLL